MVLSAEYLAQDRWREWDGMLARLPIHQDDTVLDLGCGPGTATARLAARCRAVVGIDRDPALLEAARGRCPANCRFVEADLRGLPRNGIEAADGIWSSFAAAYFPRLDEVLPAWISCLRPGGWLALVEVDRMLVGHDPLPHRVRAALARFAADMRIAGAYDFDMGSRLAQFVTQNRLELIDRSRWHDAELAFQGPAPPEILDAWRRRLGRMARMRAYLGEAGFAEARNAFLGCLAASEHACHASVVMVVARKG